MKLPVRLKSIVLAGLAICVIACNNAEKKKTKVQEITLHDIRQEAESPEPPPPPPPKQVLPEMAIENATTHCFATEGLKYTTTVSISYNEKQAIGTVTSEEHGSGKKNGAGFTATRKENEFRITFVNGDPPVVGDASEWISQPWILKRSKGKQTLEIVFNAKNHETNKWEETKYEFIQVKCD